MPSQGKNNRTWKFINKPFHHVRMGLPRTISANTGTKLAKETGLKVAISTDAHSAGNLDYMRFGLDQARRGWLEADDVLNTRKLDDLRKLLKR